MTFQPDLTGYDPLGSDAPFPASMQGQWVDAETGMPAVSIQGRSVTLDTAIPVYDLFVHEEDGHLAVLNTLPDTSGLHMDWADRTIYLFHLDDQGALSIVGLCDYLTLVRPEAIDPARIRPPVSPYLPLGPEEDFPELLQGSWCGAWHGQKVFIGQREVMIDGANVAFLAAKLIRIIPGDDAPLCSLVLDLDEEQVRSRFGPQATPMLNFMVFRSGEMQGTGAGLRDAMFSPGDR